MSAETDIRPTASDGPTVAPAAPVARASGSPNAELGAYIDDSWLDFLPRDLVGRARARTVGARVLSKIVLRHYALGTELDVEVENKHGWAHAEPERLRACALRLGVEVLAPLVRRVIERRRTHDVRAGFGASLYRAALEDDPFPAEPLPTEEFARCATPEDYRLLATRIGLALMLDELRTDAAALARRLQLLFPRGCREPMNPRPRAVEGSVLARRLERLCE